MSIRVRDSGRSTAILEIALNSKKVKTAINDLELLSSIFVCLSQDDGSSNSYYGLETMASISRDCDNVWTAREGIDW